MDAIFQSWFSSGCRTLFPTRSRGRRTSIFNQNLNIFGKVSSNGLRQTARRPLASGWGRRCATVSIDELIASLS
jgi:hypothetical protein